MVFGGSPSIVVLAFDSVCVKGGDVVYGYALPYGVFCKVTLTLYCS